MIASGKPGDRFRADDPSGDWAIWEIASGDDLASARALGYDEERYPTVAHCVAVGRAGGDVIHPRGKGEPPYCMEDATSDFFAGGNWSKIDPCAPIPEEVG